MIVEFKRILKSGLSNFTRNTFVSLSAVLVMAITLFVIGSVMFMGQILSSTLTEIRDRVDVNVYFVPDAEEVDVLALKERVELLPEVREVQYVSAEEELQDFRETHSDKEVILRSLDELSDNPLGAKLNIKAFEPSQYESVAAFFEGDNLLGSDGSEIVYNINYRDNQVAIERLTRIIDSADRLGFAMTLVLVILSILITFNTIRLAIYISKDEIHIMKLVGANRSYIRGPFVVTGIIYGIVSALITLVLFYPLTLWLGSATEDFFIGLNVFDYYVSNFGQVFLVILASGVVIGSISSYLAVKKYLRR